MFLFQKKSTNIFGDFSLIIFVMAAEIPTRHRVKRNVGVGSTGRRQKQEKKEKPHGRNQIVLDYHL